MPASSELLALLFYVTGGVIKGATRLQKIVFLIQRELGLGGFRFTASKYGPWSKELDDTVQELIKRGELIVEEHEPEGIQEQPIKVYKASTSLVEQGKDIFRDLLQTNPTLALKFYTRVRSYATLPLTYLIAYLYRKYPEYTTQSIIRERVKEWQKHYGLRSGR